MFFDLLIGGLAGVNCFSNGLDLCVVAGFDIDLLVLATIHKLEEPIDPTRVLICHAAGLIATFTRA